MKAVLTNYRQAPRKVRLVTDLIKGKKVEAAQAELSFLPKRAALPILKLLNSAIANAEKDGGANKENLFIKNILVDKGHSLEGIHAESSRFCFAYSQEDESRSSYTGGQHKKD